MRGLAGYLRFQLADYLLHKATLPVVLVLLVAGLPLYTMLQGMPERLAGPQGEQMIRAIYTNGVTLFLPLGVFLAASGIISKDRHDGYFRFYFSKPIGVLRYYGQMYLLHGVTFVALFGLLTWLFSVVARPQSVPAALGAAALTFVLVGGLGLLFGTVTRFDGGLLVLVYVLSNVLQQTAAMQANLPPEFHMPDWAEALARILPPVYRLDQLRNHLYAGEALARAELAHVLGYGLGAYALGFVALRKLPLSR